MSYNDVKFGIAGFPPNFSVSQYKSKRENIFAWTNSLSLDWIELQNTYGIKMNDEQAFLYKSLAKQYNVGISIHAPYFITLASGDSEIVKRSQERIIQSFELAEKLGSKRIIFHPGHYPEKTVSGREVALERLIEKLAELREKLPLKKGIFLYPETIGKTSQLGSIEEVIEICKCIDFCRPCIDLAHVHAFEQGSMKNKQAILRLLDKISSGLGKKALNDLHFHMYPVDYNKNGEKGHKAFIDRKENVQLSFLSTEDDLYYPRAEDFIDAIKETNISTVVVCEAKDSQDVGAILMKKLYLEAAV